MTQDGRLIRGERTRSAVLEQALRLATVSGLDGLSLSQVADALGVSKSGLFAHWRSKEALQLAVIDQARAQWTELVIRPALTAPAGVRRLWAVHLSRLAFYEARVLPGVCFFANAQFEFNARPGTVRDRLNAEQTAWMTFLTGLATEAVTCGDLRPGTDPAVLAYQTEALGVCAVMQAPVLGLETAYQHARQALLDHLRAIGTTQAILLEQLPQACPEGIR
ncbi:TetR/AcrR family transcriptional regulator [Actinoplanes derwentensis]|uniref:DNA-binding transcriptional regulator, AcrR family n=1 Tax=Actinoplanes derwentensis TaxID=113562 RepID=A0A1H2DED6_9ACTN|nr:TetR/AcrR family transcriptional regulator [Actinoplanes derwentensis]GID84777.1 TetR family transcriptional regulator [Actinoplanes derwentensis]SDT81118.1 DNA-binding transcriptional regulator, AcrR family [Actinoplanes derwentensis]